MSIDRANRLKFTAPVDIVIPTDAAGDDLPVLIADAQAEIVLITGRVGDRGIGRVGTGIAGEADQVRSVGPGDDGVAVRQPPTGRRLFTPVGRKQNAEVVSSSCFGGSFSGSVGLRR